MKRDCVRIFSKKRSEGMRSLFPPNGALSRFTKPLRRRTLRHTAFIIRRLMG